MQECVWHVYLQTYLHHLMAKATKKKADGYAIIRGWLAAKGLRPFAFQEEAWEAYGRGESGLINAPTGFGKTFSVFLGAVIDWINHHPDDYKTRKGNGLQLLWVTPLRALAKDIHRAMEMALGELGVPWRVGVRNGDTPVAERGKQARNPPEILLITPESLHLLLATKGHEAIFQHLQGIAVDEWHELLGTKRGVQVELAVARLKCVTRETSDVRPERGDEVSEQVSVSTPTASTDTTGVSRLTSDVSRLRIWAISATIGNLEEACQVLLGDWEGGTVIRARLHKEIAIRTLLPDTVERFPWAGHLGLNMVKDVLPVIQGSRTTLLFTNVRSQAERWYQALLAAEPDLAGLIALHHSAIDGETRAWVEDQLHEGTLKVVVCTASLDLGVDFRPVDNVIQIGSPKGVARFLQRAGRSGHEPGAVSNIWFVPTHSLEIIESLALQKAYEAGLAERRQPVMMAWDVLIQYMVTRAVGDGFRSGELYAEVISTHSFADVTWDEWEWLLMFVTQGGNTLQGYEEYHKVVRMEDGLYRVTSRQVALRHRMNIGTIVGDALMRVKFMSGGFVGTIEENFISRLKPGDAFILAGRRLELVTVKDMDALVRKSTARNAIVPSWMGGRLPLSASMGEVLRHTYEEAAENPNNEPLLGFLKPLLDTQKALSAIPAEGELLVELITTRDGYHLFVYPFEGRLVHQAMAAMLAYRIAKVLPISFSIAMSDYGFELLSDQPIPLDEDNVRGFFSPKDWYLDLQRSVNAAELGKRKFRDISVIAGLIFQGYPGAKKKQRHLQNSSSLIYDVLRAEEPNHLLLQQADTEALTYEVEAERLYRSLERIHASPIILKRPQQLTPFCFPIKVDSLREQLTSEKLEDRVRRMQEQLSRL
jgi:ATP-dependent Lhr-like helicase